MYLPLQLQLQRLTSNQKVAITSAAASNWLSVRLQLLAAALAFAVAALAAYQHAGWPWQQRSDPDGRPGAGPGGCWAGAPGGCGAGGWGAAAGNTLVGLSLAYCLPM